MAFKSLLFLLFFTGIIFYSLSQQQEKSSQKQTVYTEANRLYHQALQLPDNKEYSEEDELRLNREALEKFYALKSIIGTDADTIALFTFIKIGELEHYFENLQAALGHYQQAIQLQKKNTHLPDTLFFKPLLFSGIICYNQNQFDSASFFFKEAEKIQEVHVNPLSDGERLYNNLGVLFYESGNYQQAKNYFEKAVKLLPSSHPFYKAMYVNYHINIATALYKLEEFDEANNILKKLLPFGIYTNEINNNIGLINLYLGSPAAAIRYFKKVQYNNRLETGLYNDIGNAYLNLNQPDSAEFYLLKAKTANARHYGNFPNVNHGLTLKYLGDLELSRKKTTEALAYYQKSIHQLYPGYADTASLSNPGIYSGVFSYIHLFHTLSSKAATLHQLFLQTGDTTWAARELDAYRSAFALTDYVEKTYDSDEARLFLNKIKYVIHHNPIATAHRLYMITGKPGYLEQAYLFDQKNKASVLSFKTFYEAKSSAHQQPEENKLRRDITQLSLMARSLTDSAALSRITDAIRDKEIKLGKLTQQSQEKIPLTERIPSIEQLQKKILDDKATLLSYHLSDTSLLIFSISQHETNAVEKPLYKDFSQDVDRLKHLPDHEISTEAAANRLYQFLLPDKFPSATEHLVIIADDELNNLPFEILATGKSMLLEKYSVQYQFATALLKKELIDLEQASTLSMAPYAGKGYDDGTINLPALPKTKEEISKIKGKKLIDSAATKENFLQLFAGNKILHLATHAVANDSTPEKSFIAFYPINNSITNNLLFEQEIYDLNLNKINLVMLSACETGAGQLVKGEGIMSLSRAFNYAGCPNIITSLWKADDASTAMLMQYVHEYLSQGYTIATALQKAKLRYLADPKISPRLKHPSYWAHLIYIGNYHTPKTLSAWMISAIALFALLLSFFIIKKARQTRLSHS